MATINVRRDVKDSFYRYKMPKLEAKIEGKGNGIKTVIPNMPNIARALTRPPIYPTKYFGIELGAQVSYEEKNNRYIVNGAHDAAKLQDLLDGFIDKFVLCGACKNPETKLIVTKRDIQRKCGACGKRTPVNPAHRLTTYIIKNPPSKDDSSSGQHASADTPGMSSNGDGDDEQDVLTQQITNMAAQLELNGKGEVDDEWMADLDTSKEAIAERQRQLAGALASTMTAQPGAEEGDAYSELTAYVQNNPDADDKAIYEKAKELDIHKKYRAMRAVIPELFTSKDVADVNKFIKDHSKLMVSFGTDSKHQKAIIDSFVAIIANHPELMGKTSNILMALYENDLVDEEEFLEWYEKKPSKKLGIDRDTAKQIVKQAGPFLKWLEEADEESDEESE